MKATMPRTPSNDVPARAQLSGPDTPATSIDGEIAGRTLRRPSVRRSFAALATVLALLVTSGCGLGSRIPNPFADEQPTPTPTRPAPPTAAPTTIPAAVAPPAAQPTPSFTTFWVKNHRLTEMWSGPTDGPGVVNFGTTSQQFCSFQVVLPPDGPRLYVFNPHSQNYFWIDANAVGPVGPPERRAGPVPAQQNCAEAIHSG